MAIDDRATDTGRGATRRIILPVAVVEECVYDRGELSHAVNLFDIESTYADVVWLDEALAYLESIDRAKVLVP